MNYILGNKEISCNLCNKVLSLEEKVSEVSLCDCKNLKLVFMKDEIHIIDFKSNNELFYEL